MEKISGTLRHKPNRPYWYLEFSWNEDGVRKTKLESSKIPFPGNRREVEELLKKRLVELNRRSGNRIDLDLQVTELVDEWLVNLVGIRETTLDRYRYNAEKIKFYFGKHHTKVMALTKYDIKKFVGWLLKVGKEDKKTGKRGPLSPTSVRDIKMVLELVLEEAVDRDIISANPARGVRIKGSTRKKEVNKYMSRDRAEEFICFCRDKNDELTDLITAALGFGLRRGELLGLKVDDIDLENHLIHIRSTVTQSSQIRYQDSTKNSYSSRIIPFSEAEEVFFRKVIDRKRENKIFYGGLFTDSPYLFCWPDGRPYRPDYVTQHTKKLLTQFGESDLHFHSFRHSYASMLYEQGLDLLEVQRLMGHAPGSGVTLGVYTHIDHRERKAHPTGLI